MTKLEEKLKELGYEKGKKGRRVYQKKLKGNIEIYIYVFLYELAGGIEQHDHYVRHQSQIDNLQQAFNEMQKDLEILKGVE